MVSEKLEYCISPPINPALIQVRKAFLIGLSAGRLIFGEWGDICSLKKANETTDTITQNEYLYLKNDENLLYYSSIYSLKKICT